MAEVAGWIWQHNLRSLLELLSHYVGYDFDGTDWDTVAPAMEETDDERADGWYSCPLVGDTLEVEVRLARSVGGEEVSVTVRGIATAELELRTDTLLAAFAQGCARAGTGSSPA
ncbi:hypothetical protein [Streptomyces virginiae]|uniref:hypothetical protein n=1 Tax=Streptomyces virginiae TaxID=1961 RepID=UPI0022598373|nr:hypothetical protein [Streptomyces virginiae]MCX5174734.1 hypothetical protein [Streptomyces virginiae]